MKYHLNCSVVTNNGRAMVRQRSTPSNKRSARALFTACAAHVFQNDAIFLRFYSHSQRDGSFTSQWRLSFNCQSWNMSLRQTFKAFLPQIASRPQYPLLFVCVVGGRCCHDGSDTLILALLNWSRDRALASIVAPRNTLYGSGMARAAANCRAP